MMGSDEVEEAENCQYDVDDGSEDEYGMGESVSDIVIIHEENLQFCENYSALISKVRQDCKKLRNGRADEILQTYVSTETNKQMKFKLDIKVQWNSIEEMLQRYIELHGSMLT